LRQKKEETEDPHAQEKKIASPSSSREKKSLGLRFIIKALGIERPAAQKRARALFCA